MKRLLLCIILIALTASCANGPSAPQISGNRWTIMVYMDADNDLDAVSGRDLQEMEAVGSTANMTVIVQYDTRTDAARRYKVERGELRLLSDLGEQDMANPATLTDFVSYAARNYPAEHYALILWDHGNGWKSSMRKETTSILVDWTNNGPASQPTSNHLVARAIKAAEEAVGIKLDILGVDACLMATIEAAYEFRNVADILVSSQEIVQANGWDYRDLLGRLAAVPEMSPQALATVMVESYRSYAESPAYGYGDQTISALLLGAGIASLAQKVGALALSLQLRVADPATRDATLATISMSRNRVQEFDQATNPASYVDLYDFSRLLEGDGAPIQTELQSLILAEYHGNRRGAAHGLSIVFFDLPRALSYSTQVYDPDYANYNPASGKGSPAAFIMDFHWDEMMHSYFDYQYPTLVH